MAQVRYTEAAEIPATVDEVFTYRLDFSNLATYNANVSNVRQVSGDGPGKGAEYVFDLSLPGAPDPIESPLRVVEVDAPTRIVIDTGPGYMARETCLFSDANGGTFCEFDTVLTFPGEIDADAAAAVEAQGREQVRLELETLRKVLSR